MLRNVKGSTVVRATRVCLKSASCTSVPRVQDSKCEITTDRQGRKAKERGTFPLSGCVLM
jgi:hypothetical protein